MGRISAYLNNLKNQTGYTQQQLSEITDIPLGTLPRYFADADDESANFEVVRKLVVAMNGSLDELAGIAPKQLEINEEKLTADGYTDSEKKAILRWAGSEIARKYQAVVASLEARLSEKDVRLAKYADMIAAEHRRAQEMILYERRRARTSTAISYIALGLWGCLFIVDWLMPDHGWILR